MGGGIWGLAVGNKRESIYGYRLLFLSSFFLFLLFVYLLFKSIVSYYFGFLLVVFDPIIYSFTFIFNHTPLHTYTLKS